MLCSHTPDCAYQLTDPLSVWLSAARSPLPPLALPWSIIMLTWAERGRLPSTFDSPAIFCSAFSLCNSIKPNKLTVLHSPVSLPSSSSSWGPCLGSALIFQLCFLFFLFDSCFFYLLPLKRYVQFSALVLVRFFGFSFFPQSSLKHANGTRLFMLLDSSSSSSSCIKRFQLEIRIFSKSTWVRSDDFLQLKQSFGQLCNGELWWSMWVVAAEWGIYCKVYN